nr:putative reverse transcriptase domain-containing protein [Tanacetum cinerariifolium]
MLRTTQPTTIQSAILKAWILTDETVRCEVKPNIVSPKYVINVANGKKEEVDRIIRDYKLELGNSLFTIDLILLGHGSFDVIVGMTKEDHEVHLKLVLELLKKEKLYVKFSKCEFWLHEVHFLDHVVNHNNIHMEQKNKKCEWGTKQEEAFQTLKDNLCNAPILPLPDGIEDFVDFFDVSNQGLGFVLDASRPESIKQMKQAVVGEGSSDALEKYYEFENTSATDSDATRDSSCSDTDKEKDIKTDDSDDSDMDLSDNNPQGDDDAAGFGVFMYNKFTDHSKIDQNEDHILGPSIVAMEKQLKELIQKDKLTIADLEGAGLEKLKQHYKNDMELEYHVDQLKAAVLSEAQWNSDKGDVSKPRSFERHMSKSSKPHPSFYNNDFYYLVYLSTEEKYTTSLTKHYAASPKWNSSLGRRKTRLLQENPIDMINKNESGRGNVRLKGRDWNDMDVKRSKEMVDKIYQVMKRREQLRRFEEYVGGRPKTIDPRSFHTRASNSELVEPLSEPERTLNRRLSRQNRIVPFERRDERLEKPIVVYLPVLDINYFYHFLNILENYSLVDDEPMWAANHVVASTLGFAITISEIANEFSIKEQDFDVLLDEGSEILHFIVGTILEEKLFSEFDEFMAMNIKEDTGSETKEPPFEKLTFNTA